MTNNSSVVFVWTNKFLFCAVDTDLLNIKENIAEFNQLEQIIMSQWVTHSIIRERKQDLFDIIMLSVKKIQFLFILSQLPLVPLSEWTTTKI